MQICSHGDGIEVHSFISETITVVKVGNVIYNNFFTMKMTAKVCTFKIFVHYHKKCIFVSIITLL